MRKEAILHSADSEMCYQTDRGNMMITLKAGKGDISQVVLIYDDRYDQYPKPESIRIPLKLIMSDEVYDYFGAEFKCIYTRMCYYFSLIGQQGNHIYYYQDGCSENYCWDKQRLFHMPYLHKQDTPHVPGWLKESIMYQIFPDSFANSTECLEERSVTHLVQNGIKVESRFGGTLKGIISNIPYIKDLGITLLYLNPVFTANSYHKYDAVDYYTVDPCLGTNEDLKVLVKECHKNNIRVMLDLVINHSSSSFFAFQDVLKNGETSLYKDWFHIHSFPAKMGNNPNYETFGHYDAMPKFNTANIEVEEYLLDVARFWIKECDIDGYRLDVANEIPHEFWRRFRYEMDRLKNDFALIGEVWHDASSWLGRDQLHSVMNYPLMYAIWEFFGLDSLNAYQFGEIINRLSMRYPLDHTQAMMNFLDNHDVTRFLTLSKVNLERQKLAAAFLLCYIGMPSIYYGDEKAIEGADIYDSRRKMIWEDDDRSTSMHHFYQKMINIRKNNPLLTYGVYRPFIADIATNVVGFIRGEDEEQLICLFNNTSKQQELMLSLEGDVYIDLLTDKLYEKKGNLLPIQMDSYKACILRMNKEEKDDY